MNIFFILWHKEAEFKTLFLNFRFKALCLLSFLIFYPPCALLAQTAQQEYKIIQVAQTAPIEAVKNNIVQSVQSIIATPSLVPAEAEAQANARDSSLETAWQKRIRELNIVIKDLQLKLESMPAKVEEAQAPLKASQRDYQRLFALFQLSRTNPSELDLIADQLTSLKRSLNINIAELVKLDSGLEQQQDEFSVMQKELESHIAVEKAVDLNSEVSSYLSSLKQATKKLLSLRSSLSLVLEPSNTLNAKLEQSIQQIREQLPSLWITFYLTQSGSILDLSLWAGIGAQTTAWFSSLDMPWDTPLPQGYSWAVIAFRFLFILIPCLLIIKIFQRKHKRQGGASYTAHHEKIFKLCLPLVVIGLSFYFASWISRISFYPPLIILGNLFWLLGIILLAWDLRCIELQIEKQPSPFLVLLVPSFVGIILMSLAPPSLVSSLIWLLVMSVLMFVRDFKAEQANLPAFEHIVFKISPYFSALSIAAAMSGWVRLAIPFFILTVGLIVSTQLGLAMARLISSKGKQVFTEGVAPVLHAVALALGTPLAWVVACINLFPWCTALPGSVYIILQIVDMDLNIGSASFSFMRIFFILFMFYLTHAVVEVGKSFLNSLHVKIPEMERGVLAPLQTGLIYSVWGIFGLLTLNALGMSLTSVTVIAGGLSVGLGFGLQTVFNNFISGIILIFGRSLLEGDIIEIGGLWGTVRKINIRSTMVETFESAMIFVPNSELISQRLTNWTNLNRHIRRDINIRVAYGADIQLVESILMGVAKEHLRVMSDPAPLVLLQNFGATALEFSLRVWVMDIDYAASTPSEIRKSIEEKFLEHKINVPVMSLELN